MFCKSVWGGEGERDKSSLNESISTHKIAATKTVLDLKAEQGLTPIYIRLAVEMEAHLTQMPGNHLCKFDVCAQHVWITFTDSVWMWCGGGAGGGVCVLCFRTTFEHPFWLVITYSWQSRRDPTHDKAAVTRPTPLLRLRPRCCRVCHRGRQVEVGSRTGTRGHRSRPTGSASQAIDQHTATSLTLQLA